MKVEITGHVVNATGVLEGIQDLQEASALRLISLGVAVAVEDTKAPQENKETEEENSNIPDDFFSNKKEEFSNVEKLKTYMDENKIEIPEGAKRPELEALCLEFLRSQENKETEEE